MLTRNFIVRVVFALTFFSIFRFGDAELSQAEVDILQQIATTMGSRYWRFNNNGASCLIEAVGLTPQPPLGSEGRIDCECNNGNDTNCHVVRIVLKGYSLPGVLPPELARLPFLREIDFAYNYLRGPIPLEWARTQLSSISVLANRLSGEIPRALGNLTTLTYLALEANQFSGVIPPELGNLINLGTLMLSSNNFSGTLPITFASLRNLTDFRINDNNFRGRIPEFLPNLRQLTRLEMLSSGLVGPIPSTISQLDRLTDLRISDLNGSVQDFPSLSASTGLLRLVLRNCNLSGRIPAYIWNLRDIEMLDFSFNKLVGVISNEIRARSLKFMFLTHNSLSGDVPDSVLKDGSSIDLSYNNFTWQGPEEPTCRPNMNLYINMFRSSSTASTLKEAIPCMRDFKCPRYECSLHINCGGNDITVTENNRKIMYEGDASVDGGSSRFYISENNWGFSSTGDFMDDDNYQNTRYVESVEPLANISALYNTARLSPLSLTYFHYCLENGNYTVTLHFAEIQFVNVSTFSSLGRRVFDVYIQENLVRKDFNIEDEAGGEQRPVLRQFNVSVENNYLDIRFYWAGKGTTRIPSRGAYGPLISAISVNPTFKTCSTSKKKFTIYIIAGVVGFCIALTVLTILWWKGFFNCKKRKREGFDDLELQTVSFTLKQIRAATNNFDSTNKVGEGGFGPVYKGFLADGTVIAVKQLSSRSQQGNREFLNEIGMISCLQHPNLVKLHGCCIEGHQLLVVYEYMENNSLASALFGTGKSESILDWETRFKICIGIARGLAFLHEESRIKIVHRDIKATNVLLDRDLNPKISDFGLARLNEEDKTHVSTRIAGTIGYMAPEYALWGHLSDKADVYSFGVVALEIVSGENNAHYMPNDDCICLLDWACQLQQKGNLSELFDKRLGLKITAEEAERMVKVSLLCTNASPSLRPLMSEAVSMLEGRLEIPILPLERNTYHEDLRFRAIREFHTENFTMTSATSQTDMCSSSTPLTTVATTSTTIFEETHKDNHTPFTMPSQFTGSLFFLSIIRQIGEETVDQLGKSIESSVQILLIGTQSETSKENARFKLVIFRALVRYHMWVGVNLFSRFSMLKEKKLIMEKTGELIEGKVDWKGRTARKDKHGGMSSALLVLATFGFENMATFALGVNLITYFNGVMHFDIADAANELTNFLGTSYILTILMACLADAYFGRFKAVLIAASIETLGFALLTIQAHYPNLKPPPCNIFDPTTKCVQVSGANAALLFVAIYALAVGASGVKAAIPSHGADQFDEKDPEEVKQISSFFNWLLLALCLGGAISLTLIVWVQDNKGWDKGFAISTGVMFLGVVVFVSGLPYYRIHVIKGSTAITEVLQVYVAAIRNRKLRLPDDHVELYEISKDKEAAIDQEFLPHRDTFRFLDKAAIQEPKQFSEEPRNPWKLCGVTQVENAKIILAMTPIFACTIFMTLCLAQLQTFSIQQGLTMDTSITKSFNIPPASLPIIPVIFLVILIPTYDKIIVPYLRKFTGHTTGITNLQRVGVGLVLASISMGTAAIMEVKRKDVARTHNMLDAIPVLQPLPISVFWLSFQYFIFGIADMFTYVGLLEFFYSQAPKGLKSVSSCFLWCSLALGYFMSTIIVQLVNRATKTTKSGGWLGGNNINRNHLNLFYWLLSILSFLNFLVYLFVAKRYKYRLESITIISDEVQEDNA